MVERDIGEENVRIIESVPFENAIKESFKIGIESQKKWLVTIDADVLIRKNAIQDLLRIGDSLDDFVFKFEGMLYDGLLLTHRPGGIKIYRTRLLEMAISLIPDPGTQIRPETYTLRAMKDHGYVGLLLDEVVGIHDFEQHYKDVYRKCFVHSRKHSDKTKYLLKKWIKLAGSNPYYDAAILGAKEGFNFRESIPIDTRFFENHLKDLNLISPNNQENDSLGIDKIEVLIQRTLQKNRYNPNPSFLEKVRNHFQTYGIKISLKRVVASMFKR